MTATLASPAALLPYRIFDLRVAEIVVLSRHFRRVVLESPELADFADHGWDQRIKFVLPLPGERFDDFPLGVDWFARWRKLPEARRNPLRTYTVRRVTDPGTPVARLHVDMVVHGDSGPASRWILSAAPGSRLLVVGPHARHPESRAVEFRPHPAARRLVIGADETALPAVAGILERLPADARGVAVLEVSTAGDRLPLTAPPGLEIRWQVRGDRPFGAGLIEGMVATWGCPVTRADLTAGPLVDETLWEVAAPRLHCDAPLYVWLAGEASAVTTLRRHLVGRLGVCPDAVAFMGYWRNGTPGH